MHLNKKYSNKKQHFVTKVSNYNLYLPNTETPYLITLIGKKNTLGFNEA
jgi:hypothetical protein